jgi:RNA polymerase sigma factor (sigma-70 family)
MEETDANLVVESLKGSREAFGHIVARYQTLLCSIAYSATGSVSQSQDLSQETFIIAWKQLSELREHCKLRSWLCAILQNRVYKTRRSEGREPAYAAESLEAAHELSSGELPPSEQAISREEQAILWRSLQKVPDVYREPLVLFYREHQSIETVAANLDLSEDAVKQRLSRGRKLLHEQVLSFVESALERTNPGKTFTLAVLAALPAMTLSSKAATLGAAAAKGSVAAKSAGMLGLFGAILTPLVIIFGNYAGYR